MTTPGIAAIGVRSIAEYERLIDHCLASCRPIVHRSGLRDVIAQPEAETRRAG